MLCVLSNSSMMLVSHMLYLNTGNVLFKVIFKECVCVRHTMLLPDFFDFEILILVSA